MSNKTICYWLVLFSCWLRVQQFVAAEQVNITIEDTDPSIVYFPLEAWHSSSDACSECLNVNAGTGQQRSYHEAINPIQTKAPTSTPTTSRSAISHTTVNTTPAPAPKSLQAPPVMSTSSEKADEDDDDDDNGGAPDNDSKSTPDKRQARRPARRQLIPRLNANDEALPESSVGLKFNFTGSAISLFGIRPLGVAPLSDGTPTTTNLTFMIDNQSYGDLLLQGSQGNSGFQSDVVMFAQDGLLEGPHVLIVTVGEGSVFIFDYLIYTRGNLDVPLSGTSTSSSLGSPSRSPLALTSPQASSIPESKKRNVATFAAAVGGSVGVLAIFSLCLAISIIRRRFLAAKREQLDRERGIDVNAEPQMAGPDGFVPRFFPDTVIPPDPPTYNDILGSSPTSPNHVSSPFLLSAQNPYPNIAPPRTLSYADIPPDTPPPSSIHENLTLPPPPFPIAITLSSPSLSRDPPIRRNRDMTAAGTVREGSHTTGLPSPDSIPPPWAASSDHDKQMFTLHSLRSDESL